MASSTTGIPLALVLMGIATTRASAFGGIGCADLPDHDRAVGALEGMTGACDMTVERARQILAVSGDEAYRGRKRERPPHPPRGGVEPRY